MLSINLGWGMQGKQVSACVEPFKGAAHEIKNCGGEVNSTGLPDGGSKAGAELAGPLEINAILPHNTTLIPSPL